jgi:tetratricopeptide (TPR) repeat protein
MLFKNLAGRKKPGYQTYTSRLLLALLLPAFCSLLSSGCRSKINDNFAGQILHMLKQPADKTELNVMKQQLDRSIRAIDREADRAEAIGTAYKNIAMKYLESEWLKETIQSYLRAAPPTPEQLASEPDPDFREVGNYQKALNYFERSLEVFQTDETLFYNAGFCSAHIGKFHKLALAGEESRSWNEKARRYYNRAIDLNEDYIDALYGLAVLLIAELNEPRAGLTPLIRIKKLEKYNLEARLLLAYTYYGLGEFHQALKEYDESEQLSKRPELIEQIRRNKEQIKERLSNPAPAL